MNRKPISKKTRFEVFKRDSFTCQYCSSKPPNVPLEIDHIKPVCKGGTNHIDNLITACFDCNRGKAGNELSVIPQTLVDKIEIKKIALQQYREFQKIIVKEKKQIEFDINLIDEEYSRHFPEWCLSESAKTSVKKFIKELGFSEVLDSMETACSRDLNCNHTIKYFYGICWNKIKER